MCEAEAVEVEMTDKQAVAEILKALGTLKWIRSALEKPTYTQHISGPEIREFEDQILAALLGLEIYDIPSLAKLLEETESAVETDFLEDMLKIMEKDWGGQYTAIASALKGLMEGSINKIISFQDLLPSEVLETANSFLSQLRDSYRSHDPRKNLGNIIYLSEVLGARFNKPFTAHLTSRW
jgi:hypothetical protein